MHDGAFCRAPLTVGTSRWRFDDVGGLVADEDFVADKEAFVVEFSGDLDASAAGDVLECCWASSRALSNTALLLVSASSQLPP